MTLKAKAQPQPDSSGIIPLFFLLYFVSLMLYGILWIGVGYCEALSDVMNGLIKLIFSG